jgi:hypothetical protein
VKLILVVFGLGILLILAWALLWFLGTREKR